MRRRVVPTGPQPPERLHRFVAGEWPAPPLLGNAAERDALRWQVQAWIAARRDWSAVHGDALGKPLERLLVERATRRALVGHVGRNSGNVVVRCHDTARQHVRCSS